MRIIGCCILVLVLALICVGVASANPGGGVKSSPLFKASLAQSIAKLEGKVQRDVAAGTEDEDMPTGKRICPNLPLTQQTTCEPSWCGGETCDVSCGGTCSSTCTSTCASTCETTCTLGCGNAYVNGTVYWYNGLGQQFNTWNSDGAVRNAPYGQYASWSLGFSSSNGYYSGQCTAASFTIYAYGRAGFFNYLYGGSNTKPAQYQNQTVTVDIDTWIY